MTFFCKRVVYIYLDKIHAFLCKRVTTVGVINGSKSDPIGVPFLVLGYGTLKKLRTLTFQQLFPLDYTAIKIT